VAGQAVVDEQFCPALQGGAVAEVNVHRVQFRPAGAGGAGRGGGEGGAGDAKRGEGESAPHRTRSGGGLVLSHLL